MIVKKENFNDPDGSLGYIECIFDSSNLLKSLYFPKNNTLYLSFKRGGTYKYMNVDDSLYNEFENADSHGKFFNTNIKNNSNITYEKAFELTPSEIEEANRLIDEAENKEDNEVSESSALKIKVKLVHENAKLPIKKHDADACFDMYAVDINKEYDIAGEPVYFEYDTGIIMDIPKGYVGLLYPRSSITKKQMILKNSVGVIDSGFHNTIKFRFYPFSKYSKDYNIGDRIGQIMIQKLPEVELEITNEDFNETERGKGGFGHTGDK